MSNTRLLYDRLKSARGLFALSSVQKKRKATKSLSLWPLRVKSSPISLAQCHLVGLADLVVRIVFYNERSENSEISYVTEY